MSTRNNGGADDILNGYSIGAVKRFSDLVVVIRIGSCKHCYFCETIKGTDQTYCDCPFICLVPEGTHFEELEEGV